MFCRIDTVEVAKTTGVANVDAPSGNVLSVVNIPSELKLAPTQEALIEKIWRLVDHHQIAAAPWHMTTKKPRLGPRLAREKVRRTKGMPSANSQPSQTGGQPSVAFRTNSHCRRLLGWYTCALQGGKGELSCEHTFLRLQRSYASH